uniref:carnosine N-methyltransferase n=1 Tax=Guillardia theta TaxID=55529 RepID=A0A7S4KCE0_GUITH|mmetsp:Transcript_22701/g.74232  ORF Transcript_22701/g.74232 Transcript_22701/m.74232 type:complete len:407 (+) Transcript_22701:352-1572(+)
MASVDVTDDTRRAECEHFESVVKAFLFYREHALNVVSKAEVSYARLPPAHQAILSHLPAKFSAQKQCIEVNQHFLNTIIAHASGFTGNSHLLQGARTEFSYISPQGLDMDKIRCTLRQFVRDWSSDGLSERNQSYKPITDALQNYYSHYPIEQRYQLRVLLPGAGLGRLTYDIAKLGFSAQGCEFSYQMLLSSNFILNYAPGEKMLALHPWVLSSSNVWDAEAHQLKQVLVPDELPGGLPPNVDFSMVAGDFLEVYRNQRGEWDCVATCFFLDTASNVVQYVEHIHTLLADGGIWINLGPLLYHYSDSQDVDSTELSYSELRSIIQYYGFEVKEESERTCYYTQNPNSMMHTVYNCAFFVAIKKPSRGFVPSASQVPVLPNQTSYGVSSPPSFASDSIAAPSPQHL